MSAVVEFVEDVGGGIVDAVGDVFEFAADVVTAAADKVADVVRAVAEDPLPTLLAIGGQMIGIPAPLTMGAITAARGGDLEDVLLSAGTAYLAPSVGSSLTSTFSSTLIEAGVNETFANVVGSSVSKGLVNGTVAEIKGGSFDDGFAGGFVGGMVGGGVKEVGDYVKPDIIQMAQDNGFDLKDANAALNATQRAFSAGITSEITGNNDFSTAFTNSAIGSGVDYGVNSLNNTIDQQFKTTATNWDEKDKESSPIDVAITGAGIPNELVDEVQVSEIGFANSSSEEQPAQVTEPEVDSTPYLEQAPKAEELSSFSDLVDPNGPNTEDAALGENAQQEMSEVGSQPTQGGLALASDVLDLSKIGEEPVAAPITPVISEAPLGQSLTATGLAPEAGGLNAMAVKSQEDKMAEAQGLKPTDFTRPLVASAGNILKSTLMQKKARPQRPVGGLQAAKPAAQPAARPVSSPPPQKMDVAQLIPIQRATPPPPVKKPVNAPAQRLDSTAKLTPIQNIAGLTSTVKKTG